MLLNFAGNLKWYPYEVDCDAQGSLDLKYLSSRYQRGLSAVDKFMAASQRYIHCPNLGDGLPDFLRFLATFNPSEVLLGWNRSNFPLGLTCGGLFSQANPSGILGNNAKLLNQTAVM